MIDRSSVIEALEEAIPFMQSKGYCAFALIMHDAVKLLKEQEAREPHYTTLKYLVSGTEVIVHHPECPRCIENGLALWDAEIERGQAYCMRCGQAVKWNE